MDKKAYQKAINLGKSGENHAKNYLLALDYRIVLQNFHSKFGEIDIIAEKNKVIHFIEVKTRSNERFGYPEDSFTRSKYIKLKKTIYDFFQKFPALKYKIRQIDLITICFNSFDELPNIVHYKNV